MLCWSVSKVVYIISSVTASADGLCAGTACRYPRQQELSGLDTLRAQFPSDHLSLVFDFTLAPGLKQWRTSLMPTHASSRGQCHANQTRRTRLPSIANLSGERKWRCEQYQCILTS